MKQPRNFSENLNNRIIFRNIGGVDTYWKMIDIVETAEWTAVWVHPRNRDDSRHTLHWDYSVRIELRWNTDTYNIEYNNLTDQVHKLYPEYLSTPDAFVDKIVSPALDNLLLTKRTHIKHGTN